MTKLTILQINDTHSYLELHHEHFYGPDGIEVRQAGGYARLKSLVSSIRKENEHVLLFDNGDTIHGTYDAVTTKGWNMVPVLKDMAFDAMTFHWDSAYTPANLKDISQAVGYPVLALNVFDKETDKRVFDPYMITEIGGLKVGILGLAANFIDKMMPAPFHEGVYFRLDEEELAGLIEEVRMQGAELVILLSHNGFNQDIQLLKDVDGIDICLSSHTHNRIHEPVYVNDSVIIQSGSHGSFLGKIELEFDDTIKRLKHELIEIEPSIEEDEAMKSLIDEALKDNRDKLSEEVGCTKELLHRATSLNATMDDMLLEAMLQASDAQIAFSNGWRYGVPIPPGKITLGELYQIVPMDPPLRRATLTGKEIKDMIEENLEATYSCNPHDQKGGYVKRMRGLTVYIKIENPCQLRVQEILIGREKLDENKDYEVVYITKQGVPFEKYGKDHRDTDVTAVAAMRQLLQGDCYEGSTKPAVIVI